jgi:hypothetical protein
VRLFAAVVRGLGRSLSDTASITLDLGWGMPEVDPDQDAALRRLRAAFGFVEVLEIVEHGPAGDDQEDGDDESPGS